MNYFERRRERKLEKLRSMYPLEFDEIEQVALANSNMSAHDVEELRLGLDPNTRVKRISGGVLEQTIGGLSAVIGGVMTLPLSSNLQPQQLAGGLMIAGGVYLCYQTNRRRSDQFERKENYCRKRWKMVYGVDFNSIVDKPGRL